MKDARHHLKNVQKKALKSLKKENSLGTEITNNVVPPFKRPKTVLNKRKYL